MEVVRHKDGRVKFKQEPKFTGIAAVGGAFWGLLIGIIFFVPLIGSVAVGAAAGAIAGHFAKYESAGVHARLARDRYNREIRLFSILAENVKIDRLVPQIAGLRPRILRTSLSADQEEKLKEAFGSGNASGPADGCDSLVGSKISFRTKTVAASLPSFLFVSRKSKIKWEEDPRRVLPSLSFGYLFSRDLLLVDLHALSFVP